MHISARRIHTGNKDELKFEAIKGFERNRGHGEAVKLLGPFLSNISTFKQKDRMLEMVKHAGSFKASVTSGKYCDVMWKWKGLLELWIGDRCQKRPICVNLWE